MLVSWVAPVEKKDIGVIQIVGKDRGEDIFDLRNQATKALSSLRMAAANLPH